VKSHEIVPDAVGDLDHPAYGSHRTHTTRKPSVLVSRNSVDGGITPPASSPLKADDHVAGARTERQSLEATRLTVTPS
jgi:hypothetical protein